MKKRKVTLLAFSLLTLTALGTTSLTSCGEEQTTPTMQAVVIQGAKNGKIGDKVQLSAIVIGFEDTRVSWSSNDVSVASVDNNGLVTFLKAGTVQITATSVADPNVCSSPANMTIYRDGEKRLEIVSLPTKTAYKVGETFSYEGMAVSAFTYFNGVKDSSTGESLALTDVNISLAEGTTLSTKGNMVVTVSKSGYASASFAISVDDHITVKKLYISSQPSTLTYVLRAPENNPNGEKTAKFDSEGLKVQQLTYVDGDLTERRNLVNGQYSLSIGNGSILRTEGNKTIQVSASDSTVEGTSFNIMVYTEDTSVYDIIKTLQTTKNFEAEVFNNVGTTSDTTGFHYLRRYTENYYDEIDYQNVSNGTEIEYDTEAPKSRVGYMAYVDGNEKGIMEYGYDERGSVVPGRVVATGYDSWWGKASSVARLFTLFNLEDIPTYTLNDRFLTISIEQVDGDNDMGEQTAAKYPLVASFLDYCGWSSSLITIMNRFTISFNEENELTMRADFGSYGETELVIRNIGTTSVPEVEAALANPSALKPIRTVLPEVETVAKVFRANNYTRVAYSSDIGVDDSQVYAYYNEDYVYDAATNVGYGKVGETKVQKFTKGKGNTFTASGSPTDIPTGETFASYVNRQMQSGQIKGYLAEGMKSTFGTSETDQGYLYTFSKNQQMTNGTMATYQSFDDYALTDLINYLGTGTTEDMTLWIMATYKEYESDADYLRTDNFDSIELWNMDAVALSGFVMAFVDFGETSLDWVESGLDAVTSALAAQAN